MDNNKMIEQINNEVNRLNAINIERDKQKLAEMMQQSDTQIDISNDIKKASDLMKILDNKQITIYAKNVEISIKNVKDSDKN